MTTYTVYQNSLHFIVPETSHLIIETHEGTSVIPIIPLSHFTHDV